MESALTIKGQATIPKAVREHLNLRAGDRIKFFKHPNGTVVILPKVPTARLKGILSRQSGRISIDAMDQAIVAGALRGRETGPRSVSEGKLPPQRTGPLRTKALGRKRG